MSGRSKYQRLLDHLQQSHESEITLSFAEIEALTGALPHSAYHQRAWWSNRSKGALQAKAWMYAGFLVAQLDLATGRVTFRKPPTQYVVKRVGGTIQWNGELVRGLRRHMGLTQKEFAEELGVQQQTVSDWETNTYDPKRSMSKFLTIVAERAGFTYREE
ncbi:MAG: helix-turn-helix domain-containing protein [Leptolyngbyaceae cyanobacterium SL_7_1]|nr:helix-turn-helix domain-containing protein [Leptolyngbyaceae cyanobacterium SL_7_1]